jgi:hypothetical protein
MDKSLGTTDAAENYIAMQNILLGAARRAIKMPDVASVLPPEAREPRVAEVLKHFEADELLAVLQQGPADPFAAKSTSFDD